MAAQSINALFEVLATALGNYAAWAGSQFSRARDPFEVIELLGNGPATFRTVLLWMGDEPAGESRSPSIVKSKFVVTISTNRGLHVTPGASLSLPRGQMSLMDYAEDVRIILRHHTELGEDTSKILTYEGCEPVRFEGAALDAYELNFSLNTALPQSNSRIDEYLTT